MQFYWLSVLVLGYLSCSADGWADGEYLPASATVLNSSHCKKYWGGPSYLDWCQCLLQQANFYALYLH